MLSQSGQYVPQCAAQDVSARRAWFVWGSAAFFTFTLVGLIIGAPLLAEARNPLAVALYEGLSPLCHQIAERSFFIAGHPLAVCARCSGIYFGLAAGVLLYPLARRVSARSFPTRVWLLAGAFPTTLDFLLGITGLWANTHWSRALTGAILGLTLALYLVPGLVDLSRTNWRRFFRAQNAGQA